MIEGLFFPSYKSTSNPKKIKMYITHLPLLHVLNILSILQCQ